MRLEPSKSAATAGMVTAMGMRLVYALTLDAPEAANAAWLAAPIGLLLSLPVVWLATREEPSISPLFTGVLFLAMALDAANSIEWTAWSESCLAFDHASPRLLMIPLLLAILRCAWLGGDAVCGTTRLHIRLLAALMVVVILYQLPYYNAGWLRPWLGDGWTGILRTGVRVAGWDALLCCGAVMGCRERIGLRDILPGMLLATAAAALLVVLRQMMAPAMTSGATNRAVALDALLANGRAPLYLQLPMIVAWLVGMLHLMAYESIVACALIQRLLPDARALVCVAITLAVISALALFRVPRMANVRQAAAYLYHALAAAAVISNLTKGRKTGCAMPA